MRVPAWASPTWEGSALAGLAVATYAGFAAAGLRALAGKTSRPSEAAWLAGLLAMGIAVQVIIPMAAAPGYDLTKWAAVNYLPGSAGYFKVAREQALADPWRFVKEYPQWIRGQDSLHIGTHPPGLIALECILMRTMQKNGAIVAFLSAHMPRSVDAGFRVFTSNERNPLNAAERAALYATALLTLLACAGTVVPLYLLARAALPASAAWIAATLWPLAPSANLFQPVADTAYPFFSTLALAAAAWAVHAPGPMSEPRVERFLLAVGAGTVMALGIMFTLAFLPVGLIVALTLGSSRALNWRLRAALFVATGVGFLAVVLTAWGATRANPFVIASWNLHHHARFYSEYPRTYLLWLWVNPLELCLALGLPSAIWCLCGLFNPRTVPSFVWSTLFVLALVNLTGRNMGEVARLWMLFMPPLLVAAGHGCSRVGAGSVALAVTAGLLGAQTLALQSMIQVVYPV
jgi:hypothetical protein